MSDNPRMNVYVVGEKSPDPKNWSAWSEYAIVVAGTAEEARALAVEYGCIAADRDPVTLIPAKPQVLLTMPSPQWGEDI